MLKVLFSITATIASLSSSVAIAQISTPEQALNPGVFDDFCGKPNLAVCADLDKGSIGRAQRIEALRARIQKMTLESTLRQFKLPATFQLTDLQFYNRLDQLRIMAFYRKAQNNLLKFEISVVEHAALKTQIDKVRQYLLRAIDAQFSASDRVNPTANRELRAEINRTIVVDSAKLEQMVNQGHADAATLSSSLSESCGLDGMVDNAFAQQVNGNKYLVVCPGLLVAGVGAGFQNQGNFRNAIQTLAHEWGHHIDFRYFAKLYSPYLECLATYTADQLVDPGQLGNDARAEINQPASTSIRKIVSHAAEITADFWGNQAIAQFFFFNMQRESLKEKLNFLRESHGGLCGSQDEGVHPNGVYRNEILLRTDPAISFYMGCSTRNYPAIRQACTIQGKYTPRLDSLKLGH